MEILIGKQGNQPFPITEASVSRQHAVLKIDDATKRMTLRDNNSTNGTWILSGSGFKRLTGEMPVTPETLVRVGAVQTFKIKELLVSKAPVLPPKKKPEEKPVDITHLRLVYENWHQKKMKFDEKTGSLMMLRIGAMSLSAAIVGPLSMLIPTDEWFESPAAGIFLKGGLTVVVVIVALLIVNMMNSNLIRNKEQNEQFFKRKYCCPKCGFHFGPKLYENVLAQGFCPNPSCKCKYTGK